MRRGKSCAALLGLTLLLSLASSSEPPQKTGRHPGLYMDSDEDLKSASLSFYLWYGYKWLFPVTSAAPGMENFFKNQDLDFGKSFSPGRVRSRAKIVAVGDMMVKTRMTRQNSSHLFDDLAAQIREADLALGNLEGPVAADRKASAFPKYNYNADLVRMFKEQGFDFLATANNHSLDQGVDGLEATINYLDRIGILHHGTARNAQERDGAIPVADLKGIKVAFLSYTYGTNGRAIPGEKPWLVNLVDFNVMGKAPDLGLIEKDIRAARKKGAEVVVVIPHWGLEYEYYPVERFVTLAHRIADAGADIILGYHPHCLQPMEKYVPQRPGRVGLPETFIIYSLGNFIPDHFQVDFRTSVALGIELAVLDISGQKQVRINRIELTPIFFYSGKDYRILRIDRALAERGNAAYPFLKAKDYQDLEKARGIIQNLFLPRNSTIEQFLPRP
jgi:poly-gamma-glutamate capsule biosynthesis protein CapA/YwtB (metallophosphatase superfamily)